MPRTRGPLGGFGPMLGQAHHFNKYAPENPLIPAVASLFAISVLGEVSSIADGTAISVLAAGVLLTEMPGQPNQE